MPRSQPLRGRKALALAAAGALAATLLGIGGLPGCSAPKPQSRYPRVVLVTLDTLNWFYTSPYRPKVSFTPALEALAEEGVRFRYAYAPVPLTLPSHTTMLSGRQPLSTGVLGNGDVVAPTVELLPEILQHQGYRTGAFVSLGVLKAGFGLEQGFDHYDDLLEESHNRWYRTADEVVDAAWRWTEAQGDEPLFLWVHLSDPHEPYLLKSASPDTELLLDGERRGQWTLGLREPVRRTLEIPTGRHRLTWRSQLAEDTETAAQVELDLRGLRALQPWLVGELPEADHIVLDPELSIDLVNPTGAPLPLKLAFAGKRVSRPQKETRQHYRELVAYADRYLGELRSRFEKRGWKDDTLWIVVADHGEGLSGRRGTGHASWVFEEQMRVLWLLSGPGLPSGTVVEGAPARMVDVLPTVLEVLGVELPAKLEGQSRKPCWRSSPPELCDTSKEWWVYGLGHDNEAGGIAAYAWPYKWVWHPRQGDPEQSAMAFDLARDPHEHLDLLGDPGRKGPPADEVRSLLERLGREGPRRHNSLIRYLESRSAVGLQDEDRRMLESLGYL